MSPITPLGDWFSGRAALSAVLLVALGACKTPPPDDTEPEDTFDTDCDAHWHWGCPDCLDPTITKYPRPLSDDVYRRTPIRWKLEDFWASGPFPVRVYSERGEVPGTAGWQSPWISFSPLAPLDPLTEYTAELDNLMGCPVPSRFTTSELGLPTQPPLIAGHTYELDLYNTTYWENADLDELWTNGLGGGVLPSRLLLEVREADTEHLTLVLAPPIWEGETMRQNLCFPTLVLSGVDFTANPTFRSAPVDWVVDAKSEPSVFEDFTVLGDFAPDGTYLGGIELHGRLDARVTNDPDVDAWWRSGEIGFAAGRLRVPCRDGEEVCVDVDMGWLTATRRDDLQIEEVASECMPEHLAQCPHHCGQ